MRPRDRYMLWGIILGLGAPLGALVFRNISAGPETLLRTVIREWNNARFYYLYMTLGTLPVFALFGHLLGIRNEELNLLSITDGLTGIFNHRYLHEVLGLEVRRAERYGKPVSILMIDIDDFKRVNDRCGHPFGDEVLEETGRLIRSSVRDTDVVGRYGGEEFLVIMPQTTSEEAIPLAERILRSLRAHPYRYVGDLVPVTASMGLATYPAPELGIKSKDGLLSAADQALYKSKRLGKNQVTVWAP